MKRSTIICAVLLGAVFALAGWIVRDIVGEQRLDAGRIQPVTPAVPAITLITGDAGAPAVPTGPWFSPFGCLDDPMAPGTVAPQRPVGRTETSSSDDLAPLGRRAAETVTRQQVAMFGPEQTRPGAVGHPQRRETGRSDVAGGQAAPPRPHDRTRQGPEPSTTVINEVAPSWSEQTASIVAANGGIVYIGDDGRLIANTGAVSASGVVALDTRESALASGRSTGSGSPLRVRPQRPTTAAGSISDLADRPDGQREPAEAMSDGSLAGVLSGLGSRSGGATSISGLEDHSVNVRGDDQIVTYDDSNVFINRNGRINANTGDTDSSGLNAVDVSGSTVRSGNSGDREDQEEADEGSEEAEDEEPADARTHADKEGSAEHEADSADRGVPVERARSGGRADSNRPAADTPIAADRARARASVTDEGASTADGDDALVIGADGIDDVSIRSHGNRNVISYDDSNVVIGGSGAVNAQIGDSDTGGAVVMGIKHSDVRAGCEGDRCRSGAP
ncbi:hypothetical protein [Microlunatus soli]|uniref:Uncharacterized protein n=1 Tax=Microlunatus soli TaxID=630515 RepID=A0A1H1NYS6_9ACTN|nr:hypothetical protein [Microlunatus soli]SDS04103.1 hypothetical protein SAMN04489812_0700 [Microlunatus soli]